MNISELQPCFASHPQVKALLQLLAKNTLHSIFCDGLMGSSSAFVASAIMSQDKSVLFVLRDEEEAGYFYHDLIQLNDDKKVLFFPTSFRRAIKYGQKDSANEILRTEVLSRLQLNDTSAWSIVTFPEALAEKVVTKRELSEKSFRVHVGEKLDMKFVSEVLQSLGFQYTDYVYEPGQYAMRGSLIDVFSFSSEYPYRIDFFGDEVESLRTFEIESQLSKDKKSDVLIVPDLSLNNQSQEDNMVCLLDFLPTDSLMVVKDFSWLGERIQAVHDESLAPQALAARRAEETDETDLSIKLMDGKLFMRKALELKRIEIGARASGITEATLSFETAIQPTFHKNFDLLSESFKDFLEQGYTLYICSDSVKQTDRIKAIFQDRGDQIQFTAIEKTVHEGFVDKSLRICVFTDHQIFDRFHKYSLKSDKARSGKVVESLKELNEFLPGDYVVHADHGIGKFAGLVRVPNGDTTQEMIKLLYQNDDVVFVSIHSLHKVSKYKGKEGDTPRLNKLGTGAWEKLKERTKTKIKDIARDLIKLYAARKNETGFAFSPDNFMQKELEASFLYEDTVDQSKATADVKNDMEKNRPMDRLVCGDVGFGKTEVAIRAAFKAVSDNKQVAVLVPTTVLAFQHYQTFKERLKDMPCKVEYLSRARTTKEVHQILRDLTQNKIHILIGTQRILGNDVKFKDLGLLIIDEEQKFGVSTKEKLRKVKINVDTLTMSATPIPRTLQFSLMGARDLSVIQTPPPNRYPIQTEVHTFSDAVITDAINFEMSRNGQVFFVNNRISRLPELKEIIERNIPDCRVAIGHGQMNPAELEKIIFDFINYDYDVLLSTTIIENGIDIPNANTILINDAHNFGLSDLHQMRGRVGRGNRKAFCYLLAPPLSAVTPEARRRLQAIENFSDLGSGIHIAMQDLDIRGAGNMLGAEQSGFIADLGYETYQKILSEAVHELKADEFKDLYADELDRDGAEQGDSFVAECLVESDLELLLPANYVGGSSERMLLYRELDGLTDEKEVEKFRARLLDRFGPIPAETEELLQVVPLRQSGIRLGVEKIVLKSGRMTLYLVSNPESMYYKSPAFDKLIAYMMKYTRRCELKGIGEKDRRRMIIKEVKTIKEGVAVLNEIKGMTPTK